MIALWNDILTVHYRQPAGLAEQFVVMAVEPGIFLEDCDTIRKRLRYIHRPAIVPEWTVVAFGGLVVKNDEVADLLELEDRPPVVIVDVVLIERLVREIREQACNGGLDKVDGRGFQ